MFSFCIPKKTRTQRSLLRSLRKLRSGRKKNEEKTLKTAGLTRGSGSGGAFLGTNHHETGVAPWILRRLPSGGRVKGRCASTRTPLDRGAFCLGFNWDALSTFQSS